MKITSATIEYNGIEYEMELGRVADTFLGYEDHGIFAYGINLQFSNSVQGTGLYFAGENGEHLGKFVKAICDLTNANWESLPHVRLWVLRLDGMIKGFLSEDQQRILIINELFEQTDSDELFDEGVEEGE